MRSIDGLKIRRDILAQSFVKYQIAVVVDVISVEIDVCAATRIDIHRSYPKGRAIAIVNGGGSDLEHSEISRFIIVSGISFEFQDIFRLVVGKRHNELSVGRIRNVNAFGSHSHVLVVRQNVNFRQISHVAHGRIIPVYQLRIGFVRVVRITDIVFAGVKNFLFVADKFAMADGFGRNPTEHNKAVSGRRRLAETQFEISGRRGGLGAFEIEIKSCPAVALSVGRSVVDSVGRHVVDNAIACVGRAGLSLFDCDISSVLTDDILGVNPDGNFHILAAGNGKTARYDVSCVRLSGRSLFNHIGARIVIVSAFEIRITGMCQLSLSFYRATRNNTFRRQIFDDVVPVCDIHNAHGDVLRSGSSGITPTHTAVDGAVNH